jgi:malate dehydrogenase (oxaloacetate-decarboxylating)
MANHVGERLAADFILPNMDDWEVFPKEAASVAMKAIEQGIARIECSYDEEFARASKIIKRSRDMTQRMMAEGFIAEPPADDNPHDVDLETIKSAY